MRLRKIDKLAKKLDKRLQAMMEAITPETQDDVAHILSNHARLVTVALSRLQQPIPGTGCWQSAGEVVVDLSRHLQLSR